MADPERQRERAIEKQTEAATEQQTAQEAQRQATQDLQRQQNPEFLDKLQDPDADVSDLHDWVSDSLGPLLSGAHIIGNRGEEYEREAKWLDLNTAERLVAETDPGRLVDDNPRMLALAQGATEMSDDELDGVDRSQVRLPTTSEEKRVIRDGMEVATNRKSLAVGSKGLDSVTTATAEHRTVKEEQSDESTVRSTIKGMFR